MFGFANLSHKDDSHCLLKDVGVAEFNKQHLMLASYTVEFHKIVIELSTREPTIEDWRHIDALFSRINRFIATHFREEEELLQKHNYPDFANHKVLHEKFSNEITKIQSQINNRNIKFKEKLSNELWGYLYKHINEVDYQYRDFFIEKGVT